MVQKTEILQLDNHQLAEFDTEYIDEQRWHRVNSLIQSSFPTGKFRFLDVGGGNGRFTDRILAAYPEAEGTVLDNSELLLERNNSDNRKRLLNCSVEMLVNQEEKYDLICLNWLLHHLVSDSYIQSRQNIENVIHILGNKLERQGKISIFENMYDGQVFDTLPSYLIFILTSSKFLSKLTYKLGANTAGVGVCFLSYKQWELVFKGKDFDILSYSDSSEYWKFSFFKKFLLHLGNIRMGHFWLSRNETFLNTNLR